jgi:hypothetical protein
MVTTLGFNMDEFSPVAINASLPACYGQTRLLLMIPSCRHLCAQWANKVVLNCLSSVHYNYTNKEKEEEDHLHAVVAVVVITSFTVQ